MQTVNPRGRPRTTRMGVSMSTTTKQRPIKAVLNFRRLPAESVVTASTVVHDHMNDNVNFAGAPAPPVDMPALKAATELLSAKIATAADGGKTAIAQRNHQKEVVVKLLVQLAHYVDAVSESIRKVDPGVNSGDMQVTLMKFPGAASYDVRWAAVGAGGVPGEWTTKPAAAVRPPVLITGLTPGTTYVFQARAVTQTGYSDWSESVTRIAV